MTLVELLLALAIAGLLAALLYSAYHTIRTAASGQKERGQGEAALNHALDRMVRDLAAARYVDADALCAFAHTAGEGPEPYPGLSFCTYLLPPDEEDLRWVDLCRVSYRAVRNEHGNHDLVREDAPLAGPAAAIEPRRLVLVPDLETFALAFFDGAEWVETWAPEKGDAYPQAVRISLEAAGAPGPRTTTVLVAGSAPVP
jgi:type II secretion system protein J